MSSPVIIGVDNLWPVYHPSIYPGCSGPLNLDIPLWLGTVSTCDGFGYRLERNSKYGVVVCPATRTAGILAEVG